MQITCVTPALRWVSAALASLTVAGVVGAQDVVINEIMFHPLQPAIGPEPVGEEFVELYNQGTNVVDLSGWRFDRGVTFTFSNVTLAAKGYLVVAANRTAFGSRYPTVTNVAGNWLGMLGNNGEEIRLVDAASNTVASVHYAGQGDWATRQRGPLDSGYRGWIWYAPADGLGLSLQLRAPHLDNDNGQNWAAANATPGTPNLVFTNNLAPLIEAVAHSPVVPKSIQSVNITARIVDESPATLRSVTLFYRADSTAPPPFTSEPMRDDGLHGDGVAGDGIFGATVPAQPSGTVVEFHVEAVDAGGRTNLWPKPPIPAADQSPLPDRTPQALYQVDDSSYTGTQPLYKLIMIESERTELAAIPGISSWYGPDAQMNGTFISVDGSGTQSCYLCGFRNRGHGSRRASPPNYHVNFPNDRLWNGRRVLNFNSIGRYVNVLGATLAKRAGAAGADVWAAQVRVNNQNLASQTGQGMFGSYGATESYNSDWAAEHFPLDAGGNIYKVMRDYQPRFEYRGEDPAPYRNTYFKESNVSADDWTDVIGMLRVMGDNSTIFDSETAREVVNVEQCLLHLAVMSLIGNNESGLNTGNNDDYYLYRGEADPRFILMYHDLDQILGYGSQGTSADIFRATCCPVSGDSEGTWRAMNTFMHWPDFEPIYYATLQRLIDTTFSQAEFNALVDQTFANYPQSSQLSAAISSIKSWMDGRRAYVQSAITGHVPSTPPPPATLTGEPRSPTPLTTATLTVGGNGITHYRYWLSGSSWSAETPVATPIRISGLADRSTNRVLVIGRNAAGTYQSYATASQVWVVRTNTPTVRLNEVLARNQTTLSHQGTFPDLIELFNEGTAPVDLAGLRLSDDPAGPDKFTFPPNTFLEGGGCLVVFANDPDGTPGLHLGFSLNQDGDAVYLYPRATNGNVALDSVVFGLQLADQSIGRLGGGGVWTLTMPTLGTTNVAQVLGDPAALRINEWLALGAAPFTDDFIELFNPAPQPVALGGLYLSDEPIGAPTLHRIPDLSFIAGTGYRAFVADANPGAGADHLAFQLSSALGEISLKARDLSTIDVVSYTPQWPGVSQGRCADGAARIVSLPTPTPAFPNVCPAAPITASVVSLLPLNANWRYESSGNDLGTDWPRLDYDDSGWPQGRGVLGYDNGNNPFVQGLTNTALPTTTAGGAAINTFYFRTHFQYTNGALPSSLIFTNLMDDGAIVYLNGQELYRINMPEGPVTAATSALVNMETTSFTEIGVPMTNNIIRPGDNQVALELHQVITLDNNMGLGIGAVLSTNSPIAAGVVINEILANNATVSEADGSTPDWVEIYNPSLSTVDLGNMSLSDSVAEPRRWVFPSPAVLAPQGFLRVRFDAGKPASGTNTGFGLKATGDSLYLFANPVLGTSIVDFVIFGLQTPDFSIGRVPDAGGTWSLTLPTGGLPNTPAGLGNPGDLKINEWMAVPASGEDWFEVYNASPQPVALGGLWLSDRLGSAAERMKHRIAPLSFLGAATNAYQQFMADKDTGAGADHVNFKLGGTGGESLGISTADGTLIHGASFGPQQAGVSEGWLPDGTTNIVSFPTSASPGEANYLLLANVVINEVLAHTDLPLEDAVELRNPTDLPIDLGGWYLSDSKDNLTKYLIPPNTILPAHGFQVFYEYQFNDPEAPTTRFAFSSADGDQVYLSEATNGRLTGWHAEAKFGPSENGVSFGRHETSVGADFVALSALSFGTPVNAGSPTNQITLFRTGQGATNPYPKVGPIVISEIMYHPPDLVVGGVTNDNVVEEFIELRNIGSTAATLYDPAHPTNGWRLRDAVDFHFNASHALPPGGHLIVVSFDPITNLAARATFQARYGSNFTLAGPYSGKLDNGGESVELVKPDAPQPSGSVPDVLVEKVVYRDQAPWPTNADGWGPSLQRVSATGYANDPTNWVAAPPAPGPSGVTDTDGDGLPDSWENQYGFDINDPADAAQDEDKDGKTNLEEYLSGTDPRDAQSYLKIERAALEEGQLVIEFLALAGKTYTVLYRDAAESGPWLKLADADVQPVTRFVTLFDPSVSSGRHRFYRLVTPAQP
jgi:hypothetical protein